MKERFCPYCRIFKPDQGFKTILHPPSGSKRLMCADCQAKRRLPRSLLNEMAEIEKNERKRR